MRTFDVTGCARASIIADGGCIPTGKRASFDRMLRLVLLLVLAVGFGDRTRGGLRRGHRGNVPASTARSGRRRLVISQHLRRRRVRDPEWKKVSAPTAIVEFDSRDNVFTPTRGIYAETSLLASREALGASDDFERFQQLLIGWMPLPHQVTLGARASYAWSSSGTPFFLRPFVQLRGVPAMRYQGDEVASLEVEARWQFYGRWSIVAFGGGATARTDGDAFSATRNVGSGGFGFRYELARKFGLHAGIDFAHSPGTNAVYLQVGNAWFRP